MVKSVVDWRNEKDEKRERKVSEQLFNGILSLSLSLSNSEPHPSFLEGAETLALNGVLLGLSELLEVLVVEGIGCTLVIKREAYS